MILHNQWGRCRYLAVFWYDALIKFYLIIATPQRQNIEISWKFYDDRKVENIELKSVILVKPNSGNGRLWHYNSATQSRLHIKLGRVVDPIKTHILCENQEFFYKLYDTVAKKLQNSLKIRQCWICLEILNRSLDSVIKILLFKLSSILSNSLQNGISLKI